jgi:hypothetical protein
MPNIPTDNKLYTMVKSQTKKNFKVWPSAYASAWLVNRYKNLGGKYSTYSHSKSRSKNISKIKSHKSRIKSIDKSRSKIKSHKSRIKSIDKSRSKIKSHKSRIKSIDERRSKIKSHKSRVKSIDKNISKIKSRKSRSKSRSKNISKIKSRKSRIKSIDTRRIGKPKCTGLSRWFSEEWIDVCKLPSIVKCGRINDKNKRNYPYCRPLYRITSKSPKSYKSLSMSTIKKRCKQKRINPYKKIGN